MKFANLNFEGYQTADKDNKINVNIGDFIEFIAIDHLYEEMGICKEDVVTINFYEMDSYDGEPVILPINFRLMVDYPQWNIVNWSPKIIPVFLGACLVSTNMTNACKDKLREYAPIGCRDEATYNMLCEMGIDAYIGACITLTLDRKGYEQKTDKKIFFIDVPEKIKNSIPEEFRGNVEILHHEFYDNMVEQWKGLSCKEFTEQRLKRYEQEAKLIVTSRFHGTISALSLGIPVVSVLENKHDKFEVIEKIIPVYDTKCKETIDWYPQAAQYEDLKNQIKWVAKEHLMWKMARANGENVDISDKLKGEMNALTEFFKSSKKKEDVQASLMFSEDAIQYVKGHWDAKEARKIAMWGYSNTALDILEFLKENYPNVELEEIYDSYKCGTTVQWNGREYFIQEPLPEKLDNDFFVFVASNSASKIAASIFKTLGKEDVFLCKLNFITEF